jgi:hypothetical protein
MESMSIVSLCSEEVSMNQQSNKLEQEVQAADGMLSVCTYRTCLISIPEAAEQQVVVCDDAQERWRPSDESTLVSHDSHNLCLMAKKSKKKANKKEQVKEIAQMDDQEESDVEIEDSYTLDLLSNKDKLIFMKIVEKNDEQEEENKK